VAKSLCKVCLPAVPRHRRQKVVVIKGRRWQVCEACGAKVRRIPDLTREELEALEVPEQRKGS
jgi:hypothetical protein